MGGYHIWLIKVILICVFKKNLDISVWHIPGNIVWDPKQFHLYRYIKRKQNNLPILDTETSFPRVELFGVLVGSIMRVPEGPCPSS